MIGSIEVISHRVNKHFGVFVERKDLSPVKQGRHDVTRQRPEELEFNDWNGVASARFRD